MASCNVCTSIETPKRCDIFDVVRVGILVLVLGCSFTWALSRLHSNSIICANFFINIMSKLRHQLTKTYLETRTSGAISISYYGDIPLKIKR